MELEEAKEILINVMADEVVGAYCNEIQKTVECSKNCENEDCFLQQAIDTVISELHAMQNLLDEKNEELDRLQKENEELKEIDLTTVHIKGVCDEKERWRNKIREKIEEWKPKLKETDKKVEKAKNQEERVVLHCIGLRLDERIKTLEDLLKEE